MRPDPSHIGVRPGMVPSWRDMVRLGAVMAVLTAIPWGGVVLAWLAIRYATPEMIERGAAVLLTFVVGIILAALAVYVVEARS